MKLSTSLTVTGISIALLMCGLDGTAISQTATTLRNATHPLPTIAVEKPNEVNRHELRQHAVSRSAVPNPTSTTVQALLAAPIPVTAKLAKLASITGSCVGGCVTSFKSGSTPWHGCSGSSWPALSSTCRNVANFKTYEECRETGLLMGWRSSETPWYCSSLALK
jgi:hypothetical protein